MSVLIVIGFVFLLVFLIALPVFLSFEPQRNRTRKEKGLPYSKKPGARLTKNERAEMLEGVRNLVRAKPDAAAGAVRKWLADDEPSRKQGQ